jgi:hypothetical protein
MTPEQARSYLTVIARYTNATCFTGGEPFLYLREIAELTAFAKGLGLRVSVVSGAGWVRSEAAVRSRVQELARAGLDELAISWDAFHEEQAERSGAVVLARVGADEGLRVTVRTVVTASTNCSAYQAAFQKLPVRFETLPLIRLGRAASIPIDQFQQQPTPVKGPCNVVLNPVIDYDGRVYACAGPAYYSASHSPLILGNAEQEPLDSILERARHDPILELLSLAGPHGLHVLLKESGQADLLRPRVGYSSICDLCQDLTNSPEIIAAARERLAEPAARAMVEALHLRQSAAAEAAACPPPLNDRRAPRRWAVRRRWATLRRKLFSVRS